MIKIIFRVCLIATLMCAFNAVAEPARVMLMGTFHFDSPGLDVVKTEHINVMDETSQTYLIRLSERIAATHPTVVLLEFNPASHEKINDEYQQYLAGNFTLPANEIYQLGFRVAKLAGLREVHSFDEREVHWQGQRLMDHLSNHEPEVMQQLQQKIAEVTAEMQADHQSLSLQQLLVKNNEAKTDQHNMDFYLYTNAVGAGQDFVGADATASWWHRNFRMYAKMQQHASPGARLFVLGGQGHTAILRQLLNIDRRLTEQPVLPVLQGQR
ncbi:DUF5694 domain-containing protein [Marinicella sediminis]|uniref:DUF5694 domain-containing protein n=1 Tax=Marinicella sediminis TaxID=1792834 RepID=A0ABV7J429_9GAMM|nr:DUF5694 domain-containing protein [Marinicella sediminis]